jgi:hypothetical protein
VIILSSLEIPVLKKNVLASHSLELYKEAYREDSGQVI